MSISLYETRDMVEVLKQRKPPRSFLLDTFARSQKIHVTRSFDIDVVKGKRQVAPYCKPVSEGKVMDSQGFTTNSYAPPYIKAIKTLGPEDLGQRQPGNTIYENPQSPDQIASAAIGEKLAEMEETIQRAEEVQMSQALQTGKVTITGEGYNGMEIDFLMDSSHLPALLTTARWGQTTGTPLKNLLTWSELVGQDSGYIPRIAIFGSTAWNDFKAREFGAGGSFDMLKVDMGVIKPEQLPNGVKYLGYLREAGVDAYSYAEWYIDANGVEQPMIAANSVVMGNPDARVTRHYGLIEDLRASGAMKRFPKNWITENPSRLWVMLQSAPLIALHQVDAFLCATVN